MKSIWAFSALTFFATACGSLAKDPDSRPVLATINGELTNPQSLAAPASNVRVAVVWMGLAKNTFNAAVDLPVQPVFPSRFRVELRDAPPESVMVSAATLMNADPTHSSPPSLPSGSGQLPAGGTAPQTVGFGESSLSIQNLPNPRDLPANFAYALGTVVAYEDQNHNGKLDLVDTEQAAYVDKIVAANQDLAVIYFQGTIPSTGEWASVFVDENGTHAVLGYNLFRLNRFCVEQAPALPDDPEANPNLEPPTPSSPTPGGGQHGAPAEIKPLTKGAQPSLPPCEGRAWLPIDSLFSLTLANDPEISQLMCTRVESDDSFSSTEPVEQGGGKNNNTPPANYVYPEPGATGLRCAVDGSSFTYTVCTTINEGICKGSNTDCRMDWIGRPDPVPANWPCR